jgi:hypothetical protein
MTSKQRALPDRDAYPPMSSAGVWCVAERPRTPVVLIVDEDLGFVWWLSEIFSEAGCQVVPALNSEQTVSITRELNLEVDVVVANPDLTGIREMIKTLSTSRVPKIVAIRDGDADAAGTVRAQASLKRPSGWGPVSRQEWLGCVRGVVKDVQAKGVRYPEGVRN